MQQLLAGIESGHKASTRWGSQGLSYVGTQGQLKEKRKAEGRKQKAESRKLGCPPGLRHRTKTVNPFAAKRLSGQGIGAEDGRWPVKRRRGSAGEQPCQGIAGWNSFCR